MTDFLEKIIEKRRTEVARLKSEVDLATFYPSAHSARKQRPAFGLSTALKSGRGLNIIAEIKRSSPSKGIINDKINVADVARSYQNGGAVAISVLTEPDYFHGTLDDLRTARSAVKLPILRKDFTVDEFQIYEAAASGADAILLIVAALKEVQLRQFRECAADLEMDAIVEVHDEGEMKLATTSEAKIIGVNNRNLKTLEVTLDTSRQLITSKTDGVLMISESGISSIEDIHELSSLGFDGFLIGEALMRETFATDMLRSWTKAELS